MLLAIAWIITFAAVVASYAPLLLTGFLILFVIAANLHVFLRTGSPLALPAPMVLFRKTGPALCAVLLLFSVYIALSSLWSAHMATALGKAALMAAIAMACHFGYSLSTRLDEVQLHHIARGILLGTLIALVFPLIELSTDHFILNHLANRFPGLIKSFDTTHRIPKYYLNKSVTVLVLFLWPALLIALLWSRQKAGPAARNLFPALLLGMLVPVVFLSQSETAKAALILGAIGFFGASFFPRPLHLIVQTLWITAVIGVIPLIIGLYQTGLQKAPWLPYSARDRIHIWNYTAHQVQQNLFFGIGIRSSRYEKKTSAPVLPPVNPAELRDRPGWHSHNIFLQVWYELGAAGAAFLLAIGLLVLRAIKAVETGSRPFAYGAFASFAAIAAFGYGLWQSWLLASASWAVLFFLLALRYAKSQRTPPDKPNDRKRLDRPDGFFSQHQSKSP